MKYHLMNKNLLIGKFELVERYGNKIATGVELYKITPFELGNVHKWLEHRQALSSSAYKGVDGSVWV